MILIFIKTTSFSPDFLVIQIKKYFGSILSNSSQESTPNTILNVKIPIS